MYHPLLLPPEVIREMPALLDDLRARPEARHEAPAGPTYRSEAFAEDLPGAVAPEEVPPPERSRRRWRTLWSRVSRVWRRAEGAPVPT